MPLEKLSKRAFAVVQAGLGALGKDAITFRSPRSALEYIEHLRRYDSPPVESESTTRSEPVEVDPAFDWLEGLAARQGAAPSTLLTQPQRDGQTDRRNSLTVGVMDKIPAAQLQALDKSQWEIGLADDFVRAVGRLDYRWSAAISEAIIVIGTEPRTASDKIQPLSAEALGLWRYGYQQVYVVYDADLVQKRITLLLLEIS